ncbi:rho GTPase-activating protein 21 isoform X1 [Synchiropus splendidus]|uniref:rho GTPase-activating protein 21 isoform X1 n=2 Tax=Synchiropus splendidus TaxID=270530 RepID=UPI00237E3317|nr:rho GTPase-activating protein 21 isoform X1 [Synchiropus splendidus]
MMASRWSHAGEDDERQQARSSCEIDPAEWRVMADSPPSKYTNEDEAFSWPRPKTVLLRRTSQGFGFTLRHFIVYPPESALHCFPEEDHGRRGRQRNRPEPMDTIFVKQVKEGGPAHGAGLCTGDRIVKVNGASIIGKAYCEVISLIQESGEFLELCVMPKDEDILQLAYSQDAYIRGQSSYSGNACHIPVPPPICYPRVDCRPTGMSQGPDLLGPGCRGSSAAPDYGYRKEITVPPSPPPPTKAYPKSQMAVCMRNDGVRTVVVPPETAHMGRMGPTQRMDFVDPAFVSRRPASLAQYPHQRKMDLYPSGPGMVLYGGPTPHHPVNSQNIDWRTYQTYREYIDNKGIHSHGSRTIQERLDSLRTASQPFGAAHHIPRGDWVAKEMRRRSTSHERSFQGPPPHFQIPPRSASQDRISGTERLSQGRNWPPRSASQDGLVHKARAHSVDYVDPVELSQPNRRDSRKGYGRTDPNSRPSRQPVPRHAILSRPSFGPNSGLRGVQNPPLYTKGPDSRSSPMLSDRHLQLGKRTENSVADQRVLVKGAGHAVQQGLSRMRSESLNPVEANRDLVSVGHRSSSCSAPKQISQKPSSIQQPHKESHSQVNGRAPSETGVVLREKPPSGKNPSPLRHPSYILAVNDEGTDPNTDVIACWLPNDTRREIHMRRLEEQRHTSCSSNLDESLDSIPFIDEPVSPSVDREAAPIPPSAVISVAPSIATDLSSQGSPCPPIRRQLSHDQESLRSALLESDTASRSERSKSYDEGLDNYQDESRGRSSSRHMPSLRSLKKALDGHKSSGDSANRRDSSTDIFADSSKEGLLNFRQRSTDKNKRVGGGMRSWKQMYTVLQGHTLTLYKDRKEALSHVATQVEEEPLRISIKACLIDISYSDTRRKNVLRLTTSDCEYLFQAEGREEMLTWIRVIQENSNIDQENSDVTSQDLISRKIKEYNMMSTPSSRSEPSPKPSRQSLSIKQAFLGGKTESKSHSPHSPKSEERRPLRDDSSPPRDRAARKTRKLAGIMRKPFEKKPPAGVTFGVRLDDCPPAQSNRFVPLLVELCCTVVEERGLEYTGIYRVPGNNASISSMQEELNSKGMTDIDIQEDKWRDLNVISSLLKSFFRKLPEPLFTNEKYNEFIEANRTEDSVVRLKELKRLIYELPDHHFETLKFLCAHLKKVSDNCEKNKMEPRNLAIVFGPTLVRTSEDNMTNMVSHMPDQCKIVENLIQQFDWFFTEEGDEDPVTTTEQKSTVQSQPVPNIDHLLSNIGRTAASPAEVSDSACCDSTKSKSLWGSGKDQCRQEMLRSSFFVSRKRKKPKDKALPSSSDDDLDGAYSKKDLPGERAPQSLWSPDSRTEEETDDASEKEKDKNSSEEQLDQTDSKEFLSDSLTQLSTSMPSQHLDISSSKTQTGSPYASPSHSPGLSYHIPMTHQTSLSDPQSTYDDTVSDLGTMNSTSSQASAPRLRRGRTTALGSEASGSCLGAEVCSITSDYSTTSSMTFLTGAELSTISPEVQSVTESRGDDADDERSELISEGRPMETDSESDLSVFTVRKESGSVERVQPEPRPLPSHRLIECDTLSRKKSARQKTDSESSLDTTRSDKDSSRLSQILGSVKSLSSSSKGELDKTEPAWRLKITDRLKVRLRMSVDDMFGVGSQRSSEARSKKKNIRRRHTMGGQRDFAELSVLGDWTQQDISSSCRSELSAVDRLKPKCSSQDFSIGDWIARERHRTSNPEVSLDFSEGGLHATSSQNLGASSSSSSETQQTELLNGELPPSKNLSLSATAHPHKLASSQVVHSRFYQYL